MSATDVRSLGSVSNRALRLANEVAAAIHNKYPGKLVGMYAYNYHSPPPNIEPHPQVCSECGYRIPEGRPLRSTRSSTGGRKRGTTLGIREYYSVNTWDRDMPWSGPAARISTT